ncbi:hypothetical protein RHSIM_Rhsim03G0079100 [Rhododendron simsii]|uniref:Uncharacterized protein n=1 Tax=Rhododendron simsii TaxID=118357 RepID=A0A834H514_RHOSS|nr:hypothetical protein RHSIM_Rhsim03G0079100 [Rhododendron simsii]
MLSCNELHSSIRSGHGEAARASRKPHPHAKEEQDDQTPNQRPHPSPTRTAGTHLRSGVAADGDSTPMILRTATMEGGGKEPALEFGNMITLVDLDARGSHNLLKSSVEVVTETFVSLFHQLAILTQFVWQKKIEKEISQGVPLDLYSMKAEKKKQRERMPRDLDLETAAIADALNAKEKTKLLKTGQEPPLCTTASSSPYELSEDNQNHWQP